METIRLPSTASQGDAGRSCTYAERSAAPCCSQHLFLQTNQTRSSPSSIRAVLGSLGKAAPSLRGAVTSAGGSCWDTSSPPFAVTPAPPARPGQHRSLTGCKQPRLGIKSSPPRLCPASPRAAGPRHGHAGAGRQSDLLRRGAALGDPASLAPWPRRHQPPPPHRWPEPPLRLLTRKSCSGVTPYRTALTPAARVDPALPFGMVSGALHIDLPLPLGLARRSRHVGRA